MLRLLVTFAHYSVASVMNGKLGLQGKTPARCADKSAVFQVNAVEPGQVVVTDAPTNTKKNVEFGTCIWTTGIKMHPLVERLAKTLPQGVYSPQTPPA